MPSVASMVILEDEDLQLLPFVVRFRIILDIVRYHPFETSEKDISTWPSKGVI